MDDMKPIKPLRGRAATKSHHGRPTHDVAVRAFASNAGKGKTLLAYAAEMIAAGRILSTEDLQALVDSGDFGRWLDTRYNDRTIVDSVIVAEVANPNWVKPAPAAPAPNGEDFKVSMAELAVITETYAVNRDREAALHYCLTNLCPEKFDSVLARITQDRHMARDMKAALKKRK